MDNGLLEQLLMMLGRQPRTSIDELYRRQRLKGLVYSDTPLNQGIFNRGEVGDYPPGRGPNVDRSMSHLQTLQHLIARGQYPVAPADALRDLMMQHPDMDKNSQYEMWNKEHRDKLLLQDVINANERPWMFQR